MKAAFVLLIASLTSANECDPPKLEVCGNGYVCPTDKHRCISNERFCRFMDPAGNRRSSSDLACDSGEQWDIEYCFKTEFQLTTNKKKIKYLYSAARTDWNTAERFCQYHGYNLMSVPNSEELKNVVEFFTTKGTNVESWKNSGEDYEDPLGQLCWQTKKLPFTLPDFQFWLGLFQNQKTGKWENTDGTPVNWTVETERGTMFESFKEQTGNRRGKFQGDIVETVNLDDRRDTESKDFDAAILCRRDPRKPKPAKWPKMLEFADIDSVLGFRCESSPKSLKLGDIMNGPKDCRLGEDEKDPKGPYFEIGSDKRKYIFIPFQVYYAESVKTFCKSKDWFLPSVHSDADKKLLMSMPGRFGKSRANLDFWAHAKNWTAVKPEYVVLGPDKMKRGFWGDGTKIKIKVDRKHARAMTYEGYSTYLNQDMEVISEKDAPRQLYIICQEGNLGSSLIVSQASFLLLCGAITFCVLKIY